MLIEAGSRPGMGGGIARLSANTNGAWLNNATTTALQNQPGQARQ